MTVAVHSSRGDRINASSPLNPPLAAHVVVGRVEEKKVKLNLKYFFVQFQKTQKKGNEPK